jgi:hypothetical protein
MASNSQLVSTTIRFLVPPENGEPLWQNTTSDENGVFPSNVTRKDFATNVENLRGREKEYSLDKNGFQLERNSPSKHTAFTDDEAIEGEYYPEVIDNIKKTTGASRVVLFDHSMFFSHSNVTNSHICCHSAIRRRRPGVKDNVQSRQPVEGAHVDQTPKSAEARVRRHLPESDVAKLLEHRYQIINLWRPIKHAAFDHPLALGDFQSVDPDKDVIPVARVAPHMRGETYGVAYNPNLRFKYFKGMTPDEFVLIKW